MPATSLLTWTWSRILTLSRGATTVFDTAAEMPPATKSRAKSLLFIPPPPISLAAWAMRRWSRAIVWARLGDEARFALRKVKCSEVEKCLSPD